MKIFKSLSVQIMGSIIVVLSLAFWLVIATVTSLFLSIHIRLYLTKLKYDAGRKAIALISAKASDFRPA
jgi:hypothetical protein